MASKPLFRKYFLINAIVFAIVTVLAFMASVIVSELQSKTVMANGPLFFAKLVESQNKDYSVFVNEMNQLVPQGFLFKFDLIDKSGKSLISGSSSIRITDLERSKFPTENDKVVELPSFPNPPIAIIKMKGEVEQYLLIRPDPKGAPGAKVFIQLVITLILAILLASAGSMLVIFRSLRKKALDAEKVIKSLQLGDLKARFPTTKIDEATHLMTSFNTMAEEIEKLVTKLRNTDQTRVKLLQELAHDLRTPISSLKSLNETLLKNNKTADDVFRKNHLDLSLLEIDYTAKLVNDLLFLGQVMDTRYKKNASEVAIAEIIDDQCDLLIEQYPKIKVEMEFSAKEKIEPQIIGDHHLIQRLVRNALENSFSFAKANLKLQILIEKPNLLVLQIDDDGSGLSPEQIDSFGKKRLTRAGDVDATARLSVGLGSVIMSAIAEAHGGSVKIKNRSGVGQSIVGARLTINLPFINGMEDEDL